MNTDLISYYKQRAAEYEAIYERPERQADLAKAANALKTVFTDKHVFEIACGTGYWTKYIAETAASILATDINQEVLDVAAQKQYASAQVSFALADFNSYSIPKKYNSLFGGFIWSHIELQHLNRFLNTVSKYVSPGGTVIFMDNNYIEGSSTPVAETDEYGNTYQHRKLEDGSLHRVLKNFPDKDFIREKLEGIAMDIQFTDLTYYWMVQCKISI